MTNTISITAVLTDIETGRINLETIFTASANNDLRDDFTDALISAKPLAETAINEAIRDASRGYSFAAIANASETEMFEVAIERAAGLTLTSSGGSFWTAAQNGFYNLEHLLEQGETTAELFITIN